MAGAIAPLAVFATNWIPAVGTLGALAILGYWLTSRSWPRASLGALPWLLLFIVSWGALSSVWADVPAQSLATAGKMLAVAVVALLLIKAAGRVDGAGRRTIGTAFLIGLGAGLILLLVELVSEGFVFSHLLGHQAEYFTRLSDFGRMVLVDRHYARATAVVTLLLWPACLLVWRRFGLFWAVAGIVGSVALIFQFSMMANVLALVFGALVFAMAKLVPRAMRSGLMVLVVVLAIATPGLSVLAPVAADGLGAAGVTIGSVNHRLSIWQFGADRLLDRPVIGWGLRSSRHLEGGSQYVDIVVRSDGRTVPVQRMGLHPHNGLLQIWLELGLPGIVAATALLLMLVRSIGIRVADPGARAACYATFGTGLVLVEVSYGIWQGWWQATLWLVLALVFAMFGWQPDASNGTLEAGD